MHAIKYLIVIAWAISPMAVEAKSQEEQYLAIESYKCSEFLADSAEPDSSEKLIRSLVTIAWATGFAAAYQQGDAEAGERAMYLMATIAGQACREVPDDLAVDAIARAVRLLVEEGRTQ